MKPVMRIVGSKLTWTVLVGVMFGNLAHAAVAYWQFDNSYASSFNSPTLDAVAGSTATFSSDIPGQVVHDNVITNSNTASYNNGAGTPSTVTNYTILNNTIATGGFTVEAFAKLTPGGTFAFDQIIGNLGTTGWTFGLDSAGALRFGAFQEYLGAYGQATAPSPLTDGVWHHVAAVGTYYADSSQDYTVVQLYQDYVAVGGAQAYYAVGASVPTIKVNAANYTIGGPNPFDGLIDNLRITGTTLSPSQFLVAYNIPEPTALNMMGLGFMVVLCLRGRKSR